MALKAIDLLPHRYCGNFELRQHLFHYLYLLNTFVEVMGGDDLIKELDVLRDCLPDEFCVL